MPKIIFTTSSFDLDNFPDRNEIEDAGYELVLNPHGKRLTEAQITELLDEDVVGIIAGLEPLNEKVLARAKGLKIIVRCGIGMDNVDIDAATKLGIKVFNTPDAPTRSVAELTLAHILSLIRRIPESNYHLRNGVWSPLMGRLLAKQTVGIIGFGRIGRMVAHLLKAFGSDILVYDIYPVEPVEGISVVSLDSLLQSSDIITLHLPYSSQTHHLIAKKQLGKMRKSALLLNIARGGLINEDDLLEALRSQSIAGAALDCFETEPYNGPLLALENVQATAHMGSYAKESRIMMEAESCIVLMKALRDNELLN